MKRSEEMEYRATYKCRGCGKEYSGTMTTDRALAYMSALHTASPEIFERQQLNPELHGTHECKNGDICLSDFIGWRLSGNGHTELSK